MWKRIEKIEWSALFCEKACSDCEYVRAASISTKNGTGIALNRREMREGGEQESAVFRAWGTAKAALSNPTSIPTSLPRISNSAPGTVPTRAGTSSGTSPHKLREHPQKCVHDHFEPEEGVKAGGQNRKTISNWSSCHRTVRQMEMDSNIWASLVSFEFGAEVARLSLTIRTGPTYTFAVGIISSILSIRTLTADFASLKGGAGWNLHPNVRYARQNSKQTNKGSACLGGREGQRVVMEADGREGKRTLKLSQDGETQPVFFTNIPVPFRFVVDIVQDNDAVEIEPVVVWDEPQMVGGTIAVEMDE
ncbi:hypothetical protein BLNAU_15327 [Blattamonas nauphoetae]|uniref:Uncharacterized protein n=1 Tax=Blattamonas nauphoetae TaxID=2049346 RepID=A0ABQ9XB99_9EUKA|nr:hypothetical protein BLNAU_15327 [Blattamonas nauphoetae]